MKLKAGGVDNISTNVIKSIIEIVAGPLAYLFNRCIELAIWPDALKIAAVVPIHNKAFLFIIKRDIESRKNV